MIGAVLLGTLGGWWLDGRLGTEPWLLVAGSMLGLASGMFAFLRAALRSTRRPPPGGGAAQEKKNGERHT